MCCCSFVPVWEERTNLYEGARGSTILRVPLQQMCWANSGTRQGEVKEETWSGPVVVGGQLGRYSS